MLEILKKIITKRTLIVLKNHLYLKENIFIKNSSSKKLYQTHHYFNVFKNYFKILKLNFFSYHLKF